MSDRKKEALLAELRDLTFRVCAAAGALAGLYAGFESAPAKPADCARGDACVAETLLEAMTRVLGPAGLGLLVGALVGVGLAQLFRRRRGVSRSPTAPVGERERWIVARYAGACRRCGSEVAVGERVLHSAAARTVTCGDCATA